MTASPPAVALGFARLRKIPFLLYGILAISIGMATYLLGILMVVPRYLLGLRARLLQVDSAALGEAVRCLGLPGDKSPALPLSSATGDSGAAESTIQDAGWNGGQPAWQLRILSICANALSLPSRPA
jgi:hypothetical protein